MFIDIKDTNTITKKLKNREIGILPTDTVYGIHCLANDIELIKKVARIKLRDEEMPMISIISGVESLKDFGIKSSPFEMESIENLWPGPNTLIFDTKDRKTKAFRLPNNKFLIDILEVTGPLISTSANKHGIPPAKSLEAAKAYFGNDVDFYVDGGTLENKASSIYKLSNTDITQLR